MPPKAKITKEMILHTVLVLTRETGFENVNARSIAKRLECSTRPIFTCYENMDALKQEFFDYAYEFYNQYVIDFENTEKISPVLLLPLSYIKFAQEETHLFKYLFINDMDLNMTEAKDFYKEMGNEVKAKNFSDHIGIEAERGKILFLDLFLYSHGIAVLTATGKLSLSSHDTKEMLSNVLSALVVKEKQNSHLSI